MTAERELEALRARRDAACATLAGRIESAKAGLAPATIRKRVVADARHKAIELANEAVEIANDSRGIVVATGMALVLWLARKPIGQAAAAAWEKWQPEPGTLEKAGDWLIERVNAVKRRATEEDDKRG